MNISRAGGGRIFEALRPIGNHRPDREDQLNHAQRAGDIDKAFQQVRMQEIGEDYASHDAGTRNPAEGDNLHQAPIFAGPLLENYGCSKRIDVPPAALGELGVQGRTCRCSRGGAGFAVEPMTTWASIAQRCQTWAEILPESLAVAGELYRADLPGLRGIGGIRLPGGGSGRLRRFRGA